MDLCPRVHLSAMEPSLNNERIKIHQAETFTTKAQICGATPPVQEFHYMVKQGKQACGGLESLEDFGKWNSLSLLKYKYALCK
ncbi:hypothetical protein DPMN_164058 [Dreissena polymorpha]|uniref:Uncharacterized protein n=1 Tax=Dreissena polymorpha TaxID=45954 RepID=A0A9D4IV78_DREPO|nr:hypothetical protein DPMN_164058 [Dreissena polymorpha]